MPGQTEKAFDFLDGKRGLSPFSPRFLLPTRYRSKRSREHIYSIDAFRLNPRYRLREWLLDFCEKWTADKSSNRWNWHKRRDACAITT
jgi:hypothetical protein